LWLIKHHPESELVGSFDARITDALGYLPDPVGYQEARKLWLEQTEKPDVSPAVLGNAAAFFSVSSDKQLAERMLLRAQALDATPVWSARLGQLYEYTIASWRRSNSDTERIYAQEIQEKVAGSTDLTLLLAVGQRLLYIGPTEEEALGTTYLE